MGMAVERAEAETDFVRKAASYRIAGEAVDGMDVVAVERAALNAVERIRSGGEPYFLECRTYRFRAHSMFDAQLYRSKGEIEAWREKGPIERLQKWLEDNRMIKPEELAQMEREVDEEIAEAVAYAEAGALEPVSEVERFVTMERVPS